MAENGTMDLQSWKKFFFLARVSNLHFRKGWTRNCESERLAFWPTCAGKWLRTITSDRTVRTIIRRFPFLFALVDTTPLDKNCREVINLFVLLKTDCNLWRHSSARGENGVNPFTWPFLTKLHRRLFRCHRYSYTRDARDRNRIWVIFEISIERRIREIEMSSVIFFYRSCGKKWSRPRSLN